MLVCDCNEIYYSTIKEAVARYGDDIQCIKEFADVGTACELCLEDDCEKVELPLSLAIQKALNELA